MKQISVVIPTYNGQELLAKHLPAVFVMLNNNDEVIIVDDCSTDKSVAWLIESYQLLKISSTDSDCNVFFADYQFQQKQITILLVQNKHNLRFPGTANRGVSFAKHHLVLLLNNDVAPAADILTYLVPHFENKQVFGVGCLEKQHEELHQDKVVYSGKNVIKFQRGMFIHQKAADMKSGSTAWVSGGSGMFDVEKWRLLGGFDLAFSPAYWEDVDLSFRARERGWQVLFESQALVNHNHESTNAGAFGQEKIRLMSWRNARHFTIKNSTWLQKIQFLIWYPYWWWKVDRIK